MHRHSYSRGRQQQWSQSPLQRGTTPSEVHSQTPSRSPSRLPSSQLRDEWLHCSSSCPQQQPRQQEFPGEEVRSLQLPADLAGFLKQPEAATDELGDAQSSSTPIATCPHCARGEGQLVAIYNCQGSHIWVWH